jgi:hypothetical protein
VAAAASLVVAPHVVLRATLLLALFGSQFSCQGPLDASKRIPAITPFVILVVAGSWWAGSSLRV